METRLTRRTLQKVALMLPAPLLATIVHDRGAGLALAQNDGTSTTRILAPTPACGDGDDPEPTMRQTAGPFYTPNTPERISFLEPGELGSRLFLSGYVYDTSCQPVPGALLDFWHCDAAGVYDNTGFRFRGHQFAAADGRFELETVLPAVYPGRTRHIHVIAQAPNQPVLTTQLYFPDEPANDTDGIFNRALLMDIQPDGDSLLGFFTFVLHG